MVFPFFRSSLLNTLSLCPLRCFIEYSVGIRGGASKATLVGSTVHGVMELRALAKLAQQNNRPVFTHDSFKGEFNTDYVLSNDSIDDLLKVSYEYYDNESPNIFLPDSYVECRKLVDKALAFHKGAFDPKNSDIYAAELPFEVTIEEPWAHWEYESPEGKVGGQLSLKGTIDLVCVEDADTLHCLDYKTSKGLQDWATGKEKTELSLYNDQQMMLYFYVLSHKFPDKNIMMTLYFIRLDKAFTLVFDKKKDLPRIHQFLRDKFELIKSTEKPSYIDGTKDGWKCRWCDHSKNKYDGTKLSVCKFFQRQLANKGHDQTLLEYADFSLISSYGAGGSSKDRE